MILFVGLSIGMMYVVELINDFLNYDTTSTTNMINEAQEVPSLIFCNNNLLRKDLIQSAAAAAGDLLNPVTEIGGNVIPSDFSSGAASFDLTKSALELAGEVASDFIAECSWRNSPCNSSYFRSVITPMGRCFIFDPELISGQDRTVNLAGPESALVVWLNVQAVNYLSSTETTGAALFVLEEGYELTSLTPSLRVSPGFSYEIGMHRTVTNFLGSPHGNCTAEGSYDVDLCEEECMNAEIFAVCDCVAVGSSGVADDVPACTLQQQTCQDRIRGDFATGIKTCDRKCEIPCQVTQFGITHSAVQIGNPLQDLTRADWTPNGVTDCTELTSNYIKLDVNFRWLGYTEVTVSPQYSLQDFLGAVGGMLGLYSGFSLLSTFEFLELLFIIFPRHLFKKKQR